MDNFSLERFEPFLRQYTGNDATWQQTPFKGILIGVRGFKAFFGNFDGRGQNNKKVTSSKQEDSTDTPIKVTSSKQLDNDKDNIKVTINALRKVCGIQRKAAGSSK